MIKFLFFISIFCQQDCRDNYLDKVLRSEDLARYYIVVDVATKKGKGQAVVLNNNLFRLLKSRGKNVPDIESYKTFVKSKIVQEEPITLSKKELSRLQTRLTNADSSVLIWASKGEKAFVEHFFKINERLNYAVMKENVSPDNFTTIIKVLFNWNYLMSTVEGKLTIEQLDFCNKKAKSN